MRDPVTCVLHKMSNKTEVSTAFPISSNLQAPDRQTDRQSATLSVFGVGIAGRLKAEYCRLVLGRHLHDTTIPPPAEDIARGSICLLHQPIGNYTNKALLAGRVELTEGAVTTENGRLFHTFVILMLNEYFRRL